MIYIYVIGFILKPSLSINKLSLSILLILFSCGNKPPVDPQWINKGSSDLYWVGVGQAKISADQDYREQARTRALALIASQIEVCISETLIDIIEARNMVASEYNKSITETRIETNLKFVEFVDNHQTKNTYYVYARLNKQKYFERIRKEIAEAAGIALDLINQSEIGPSITSQSNYLQALKEINPYLDQFPIVSYQGRDEQIYPLLLRLFRENNDRMEIVVKPESPTIKAFLDENVSLSITVVDNRNNNPIPNVPIAVNWKGRTESSTVITNEKGKATFVLDRHWVVEKNQVLTLEVNYENIMIPEVEPMIDFTPTTKELNVDVVGPKIFLSSDIKNMGNNITDSALPAAVKKHFIDYFSSEFVSRRNLAELELKLSVTTFEKTKRMNEDFPHIIYGNGVVELIDISNGDQILSNNIKSKGGDFTSKEVAGIRAIDNLAKQFENRDLFGNKND